LGTNPWPKRLEDHNRYVGFGRRWSSVFISITTTRCPLEWTERILGAVDDSGIKTKYQEVFWEGGSKRSLKAIRDKWSAAAPPVERQNRQRQTKGSMQSTRDQVEVDMTEEGDVGLV